MGNCPINEFDIPGEGLRLQGSIGGLAVEPFPANRKPGGVARVSQYVTALAFSDLDHLLDPDHPLDLEELPAPEQRSAILVVDDFNGGVYSPEPGALRELVDGLIGIDDPSERAARQEELLDSLEANGELSHGALIFNHTLALLNVLDPDSQTDNESVLFVDTPAPRTPFDFVPLDVVFVEFEGRGVLVAAVDTEDFNTDIIAGRIAATIHALAEQERISRFAVNLSFGLVPCSVLEDFQVSKEEREGEEVLTFENYLNEVLNANNLDAERFRKELAALLSIPVGTAPLRELAQTAPETFGGVEAIAYLAAAGNYGHVMEGYSLYPGYWPEFVSVSAADLNWDWLELYQNKKEGYSNTGEVLLPGGFYQFTLAGEFSIPGVSVAGTSFAAPAASVFTALDYTNDVPRCRFFQDRGTPLAFLDTDNPPKPLPLVNVPLWGALEAYCPISEYSLSVDKTGTGSGTVTSDPAGIDCGGDCSESYAGGTTVTLSATPDGGSVLSEWSGCNSATGTTCTVEMNGDRSVTATFMPEVITDQFGTSEDDSALSISVDSSGIYVVGITLGDMEGSNAGNRDAFVRKYDAYGEVEWTRQFGTSEADFASSIGADNTGIYIAGNTVGNLAENNAGGFDAFVRKYNVAGDIMWTRQFGTSQDESATSVSVNSSGVYVAGDVRFGDAFVRKYDSAGNLVWSRQFGASGTRANSIGTNSSGVYVAGTTEGDLGGSNAGQDDAFVRKYDSAGNLVWSRQFGTSEDDSALSISMDSSGVYITGYTDGALQGTKTNFRDAFVRKYSAAGEVEWTAQFGSTWTEALAITVDASSVYVVGQTAGDLEGRDGGSLDYDAFVRKYDAAGNVVWTKQFGSPEEDAANFVSVNSSGVYVAGDTEGALEGSNAGERDAFVRIYYH